MRFPRSPVPVICLVAMFAPAWASLAAQETTNLFKPMDVFGIEVVADPQISPDGDQIVFVRSGFDVMTDRATANLWIVDADGSDRRPLTTGSASQGSPRWSPTGDRLLYVSSEDGGAEIWMRWMDTGETGKLTNLTESPGSLAWSPDGDFIAFTMFVPEQRQPLSVKMPTPPEGADWGPPIRVIDKMNYRADGNPGFVPDGYTHLFVVPSEGGTPRQLTTGSFHHNSPAWMPDGRSILISANRRDDADHEPMDTEVYRVDVETGRLTELTERYGPDGSPIPSPSGDLIAYTGFDDQHLGFQLSELYVMNADGSDSRLLSGDLDRSIGAIEWAQDGSGLFFSYDDEGNGKIGFIPLGGRSEEILSDVQGLSTGRPYGGGQFSVSGRSQDCLHLWSTNPSRRARRGRWPRRERPPTD